MVWVLQQLLPNTSDISGWARLLWFAQALFLVLAGELHHRFHPDWTQSPSQAQASSPALPYLALLMGYGLVGWVALRGDLTVLRTLLVGGLMLTLLVVMRQALAHIESTRHQQERERLASESKLAKLIENAAEGIVVLNANYRVLYASPAVGRLLQLPHDRLMNRSMLEFLVPDDGESLRQCLAELGEATGRVTRKLMLRLMPQGTGLSWVEATLSDRRRDPELAGIVINLRDVTEHHQLEDQIRFEALHDALTQLPNRDLFLDRTTRALHGSEPGSMAVMVIDLNQLRQINDSLGHSFGDQALVITADRLRAVLGSDGTLARLSAEDFAVLIEASQIDHRADQIHAAFAEPFVIGQHRMPVSLDIGVAVARTGATAQELLRDADTACTRAKEQPGKRRYERFVVEQHEQAMAWLALQSTLPEALASGRLCVYLEPIVSLIDGFPFGLRPRLRWTDPAKAAFPIERVREVIASGNELGLKVGEWVIAAAEREYASVLRFLPAAASLSLLSPVATSHLLTGELPTRTRDRTTELGIPPVNLLFSVTESSLFVEQGAGLERLRELRAVGARLALAEFGGRGSSLAALQEPMLDAIVLARELVSRLGPHSRANALVRGVIAAAESVGTRVIAAGVETDAQQEALIDQGCLYGIGPALAKPMAAEHLLPWLGARFNERDS
ncbi:MAG: diguanylate cyclase [Ahniella sp.]|nr:diguanylate cyclase [Ahniella sp.]